MAETEITNIKLTLTSNIKEKDVKAADDLIVVLEKFNNFELKDGVSASMLAITKSLGSLNGLKLNASLGKGIESLTNSINGITNIQDITPYAENLNKGFSVLANAAKEFEGMAVKLSGSTGKGIKELVKTLEDVGQIRDITPHAERLDKGFKTLSTAAKHFEGEMVRISPSLGRGISGLIDSMNEILYVKDITPFAGRLDRGFKALSDATKNFVGNNATISVTLGRSVTSLVEAINSITTVKDITPYAQQIENGFAILSKSSKEFEDNSAKIPVTLGRGISGIIDAVNQITQVKDLMPYATRLEANFAILSKATRHFEILNRTDYSGITRLVTSLVSVGKVKPIDDTVVKNAEKLAQAINILDENTSAGRGRINALANATRELSVEMNKTSKSTSRFGNSLGVLNLTATIFLVRQLGRGLMNLARHAYGAVDAFGDVQNTLSFFTESLGDQADQTARIIQNYADMGAIDFTQFADQVSTLNQVYKGYGISAENASKMALNMTQLAYDASYALGQNGKDIALWNQRALSVATGQTRSGYYFGVDTSVKQLSESFDEMSSNSDKATRSMAAYNAMIDNTKAIQGQLAREFGNTYVQMQVFQNRLKQLTQSIGAALIPVFEWAIKTALVTLKVIEMVIDSIFRLFGKEFKLINYADMINEMQASTTGLGSAANDVGKGFDKANKAAKALKKTITGIDQVFTIDDSKPLDSNAGGIGGGFGGAPVDGYLWDELASQENMLALADIQKRAEGIFKRLQEMLPVALALGGAFAAWKIVNFVGSLIETINKLDDIDGILGGLATIAIGVSLFLVGYEIFKENLEKLLDGDITWTTVGLTIGSAILTGIALALTATGIFKVIARALPTGSAFSASAQAIGSSIGSFIQLGIGFGLALGGLSLIIAGIKDAFENGASWKNVGMMIGGTIMLGIAASMTLGAVRTIIEKATKVGDLAGPLGGIKIDSKDLADTPATMKDLADKTTQVDTSSKTLDGSMSKLTKTLKDLAKNLAIGLVIILEVAAAALIIVGAIWALGKGLEQVGLAWKPVIDDGANVALGITIGVGLLVGVGFALSAIGGLGTAVLAPMAIGTGVMVALTAATLLFIYELKLVADSLTNQLAPAMASLNEKLPDLTEHTRKFTLYMVEFAGHVLAYSGASAVAGIGATIDTIVGWFTKDPIKKMADDAKKNGKQFDNLVKQLEVTNPLVKKGVTLLNNYMSMLEELQKTAAKGKALGTLPTISTDFKAFSRDLRDGFKDLEKVKTQNVDNIMKALGRLDLNKFKGMGTDIVKSMELGMTSYNFNLTTIHTKIKNALKMNVTIQGQAIARDLVSGINGSSVNLNTFKNKITNGLKTNTRSIGSTIGRDVISGINGTSVNIGTFTSRIRSGLATSTYSIGTNIARGVQNGINGFYPNVRTFTDRLKRGMRVSFEVRSPSRWARDIIGYNIAKGVEVGVNDTAVSFMPFRNEVEQGLSGITSDLDVTPKINMPEIDASRVNGNIKDIASNIDTKVVGTLEVDNDKTEKAIDRLIATTEATNSRLERAIERGQNIVMDGEVVTKKVTQRQRSTEVNNNIIFE